LYAWHKRKNIYGRTTLADINYMIECEAERLNIEIDFFQSYVEGKFIDL
jgi:3-dehydroquinate dehydratase